jgi:hypothetical protein
VSNVLDRRDERADADELRTQRDGRQEERCEMRAPPSTHHGLPEGGGVRGGRMKLDDGLEIIVIGTAHRLKWLNDPRRR